MNAPHLVTHEVPRNDIKVGRRLEHLSSPWRRRNALHCQVLPHSTKTILDEQISLHDRRTRRARSPRCRFFPRFVVRVLHARCCEDVLDEVARSCLQDREWSELLGAGTGVAVAEGTQRERAGGAFLFYTSLLLDH